MDNHLLDTSFTLYHVSESSVAYLNFCKADQYALATWSRSLKDYLETHTPRYKDDLNDETEKSGVLRECKFTALTGSNINNRHARPNAIVIEALYSKTPCKYILYGASNSEASVASSSLRADRNGTSSSQKQSPHSLDLILAKSSPTHLKRILSFLEEKFAISTTQLRLPSSLLLRCLQNYIISLSRTWTSSSATNGETSSFLSDPGEGDASALRQAILKPVLGVLKITITISVGSEVAPDLKTIELDIPSETIGVLSSRHPPSGFLEELAKHIHERTGLILPLTTSRENERDENTRQSADGGAANGENQSEPVEPPLRISKVICAAFAIGVEGRLKFASRPIDTATTYEEVVRAADVEILDAIAREARRQSGRE